ncbi:NAD(P)-binding protein [Wolfiporia cocos MD-104 SS10]|uniref:NAD(P)-binding protein n=1 Tax=Wolfiporia cocos (strain MD-104) TaxID=742152 RepID=A0A2H3JHW0_WOLCO|nr:NAD(P)-binding protein [Wolfiporia cocos MD-104 SS10]
MAPVKNGRLVFSEIPTGLPEPGKTTVYDESQTIDLESVPLSGGILVKTLVLSIDPYLRGRMRDANIESYAPPFIIGEPLDNYGVGLVLRSEHASFKAGDHVYGTHPFQRYFVAPPADAEKLTVLKNEEGLPWSVYVGVCGMPGQTAHHAWREYSQAKPGETVFITTGAGPVGATVIQIAKQQGLKVIASAGSEEKVAFIKSLGADVAFNYKTERTRDVLARAGPIDIFWDNVGGETLEAAIDASSVGARFIECGAISAYNGEEPYYVKNLMLIMGKQLKISGFIVMWLHEKHLAHFYETFPRLVKEGKINYTEDATRGLERAGHAIVDVQTGRNTGKSVVIVSEE